MGVVRWVVVGVGRVEGGRVGGGEVGRGRGGRVGGGGVGVVEWVVVVGWGW